MVEVLLRRVLRTIPVLLGISALVFVSMRLIPGDPALIYAGDQATGELVAKIRVDLGLDQPLVTQYVIFLRRAIEGDLVGCSWMRLRWASSRVKLSSQNRR